MKITDKQFDQIEQLLDEALDRRTIYMPENWGVDVCNTMHEQFEPFEYVQFVQFINGVLQSANVITIRNALTAAREMTKCMGEFVVGVPYEYSGIITSPDVVANYLCRWHCGELSYDKEKKTYAAKTNSSGFTREELFSSLIKNANSNPSLMALSIAEEKTYGKKAGASASSPLKFSNKKP